MLQFMDTTMFKSGVINPPSEARVRNTLISEIINNRISEDLNKCILKYEDIEHHIEDLKKKNRGTDSLLDKGIDLYKNGQIILFDGELTSYDKYKLPPYLLFIPLKDKLLFNINGMKRANWKKVGENEYEYHFSNMSVELKFLLVAGAVMYKILVEGKSKDLFNDQKLMPIITMIYVDFFKKAIGRLGSSIDDWDKDKLNYVLSKFFWIHSLGYSDREADKIVSNIYNYLDYQIADIKLSEEGIEYNSLETFIPSMTKIFYKKEIDMYSLINSWANSFGSTIFVEMEYFPALLTHLLVLIFGVDFVNERYDLRSRKEIIYQRLTTILK